MTDHVLYPQDRLEKTVKDSKLCTLNDKWSLMYDAFALAIAGLGKFSAALTLVNNLRHERECK